MKNSFFLLVFVSSLSYAVEKWVENCGPTGIPKNISIGSEGTVQFELDSDASKTFYVRPTQYCQHQMMLQTLLRASDAKKLVCLRVDDGFNAVAVKYDVAKKAELPAEPYVKTRPDGSPAAPIPTKKKH